ncbi:hypothetical protein CLOSTASPAR_05157 [[Clostridium] asparagiforme DSM 15981]|uniref:Uncharacterized protein n=1 Tax=[Clostridium] asparagiforme DSM 15981 TaxID=518636 RepID=C0D7B0_9FIRM|nr:hypothetical protein CLOSTASPAR_05157 [[Clostridium] asparagiforme DSM 15981]
MRTDTEAGSGTGGIGCGPPVCIWAELEEVCKLRERYGGK